MSDYRTATGFAARVRETSTPPPPRPPADKTDIDLTVTPEPGGAAAAGDQEQGESERHRPRLSEHPSATGDVPTFRPPADSETAQGDGPAGERERAAGERQGRGARPVSLQLEGRHIAFIRDGAQERRLFVNVWLRRVLTEEAELASCGEPVPAPPSAQGPDDFVFYRQFSARLHPETIERLDTLADEQAEGNRSHLVRVLLDRADKRYRTVESGAAT